MHRKIAQTQDQMETLVMLAMLYQLKVDPPREEPQQSTSAPEEDDGLKPGKPKPEGHN